MTLTIYDMGSLLRQMRESGGYRYYADTFDEYIKLLGIARRTAYNYLAADRAWRERLSKLYHVQKDLFSNIHHSYIYLLNSLILAKNEEGQYALSDDDVLRWLEKAKTLPYDDFKEEVRDYHHGREFKIKPKPIHIKFTGQVSKVWANPHGLIVKISKFQDHSYGMDAQGITKAFKDKPISGYMKVEE